MLVKAIRSGNPVEIAVVNFTVVKLREMHDSECKQSHHASASLNFPAFFCYRLDLREQVLVYSLEIKSRYFGIFFICMFIALDQIEGNLSIKIELFFHHFSLSFYTKIG